MTFTREPWRIGQGRMKNAEKISEMLSKFDVFRGRKVTPLPKSIHSIRAYSGSGQRFLGQNKWSRDQYKHSMARYEALASTRGNLLAVIMPAGCGKTSLAVKYGCVDVDELVSRAEHDSYVDARSAIIAGKGDWIDHNNVWFDRINQTLDLLDYSRPVIVFVHTEETALEIGAKPIAHLKLTKTAHEMNIRSRDSKFREFSRISLERSIVSEEVPNQRTCGSNRELEAFFLSVLNVSGIPVGGPHQFSDAIWNESYAHDVPGWVLRGERLGDPKVSINQLRLLYDEGRVPKECVDYYVRHSYVPTQFDFGVSMFEWSQALGQLPPCYNNPTSFDTNRDMLAVFPPESVKEVSRSNVKISQLIQTFDIFSHPEAYNIAMHHVGERHTFVTNLLCCWKGITEHTSVAHLAYPWFQVRQKHWANKLKTIHSLIRCSRFLMNTEISEFERQSLMYMDLLVGRGEYKIDEMAEVELRGGGSYDTKHLSYDPDRRLFTNRQYKDDFIVAVEEAYARLRVTPKPVNVDGFLDFYQRRASWATKGGLVYNKLPAAMKTYYATVLDAVYNTAVEVKSRHNKKSLFEVWEIGEVLSGVNETNFNITSTQIKYEVGNKDRTLLPGTLAHFIVFTYVLHLAEKQMQIGSVRLNVENEIDIRYVDRKMMTGVYHVLYDWANFNEQHSAWEMGLVIEKLNSLIVAPRDYSMFVEAIVAGMYNMGLQDREGKIHKIWQGLYSGWRGTTWVNTVLNFCYVHVALVNVERLHGVSIAIQLDHGGDDIDLGLSEPVYMPLFLEVMDAMLFKANKWKQMFGVRSEFFRTTVTNGQTFASPTRALASFVAGDWEGAGRATIRERVVSLLDQIAKLRRRGCSEELCQGLTVSCVSHWCKVRDGEEWLALPPVVLHGRQEDGGLGIPDRENMVWELDDKVPEVNDEWYKVVVPDYKASLDYVSVLQRDLDKFCMVIERREELARKLAEDSFDVEKMVDHDQWRTLLGFRCGVRAKHEVAPIIEDHRIFEGFMEYEVEPGVEEKFDRAARFQEFTSYLSFNGRAVSKEELVHVMSDGQVSLEALEFQGDIYYARLVPEFISYRATLFCRDMLNQGVLSHDVASYAFQVICGMSSKIFKHMS